MPTPELVVSLPKEIRLEEGLVIHNMGTKYGWVINDEGFRDANGVFCPDGDRRGACRAYSGMAEVNLNYVKQMFARYRNLANGGKGKTLEIFFYDSSTYYPFWGYPLGEGPLFECCYKSAREVGNTIELHIGVNDKFSLANSFDEGLISFELHMGMVAFLSGNHDTLVNYAPPESDAPQGVEFIAFPPKFTLRQAVGAQ